MTPQYAANSPVTQQPSNLEALGIPAKDDNVNWPLAFRLMPPDVVHGVRDELENQLRTIAAHTAAGRQNLPVLKLAMSNVDAMRTWLRGHRLDMADAAFSEGQAFLHRIDNALKTIRASY